MIPAALSDSFLNAAALAISAGTDRHVALTAFQPLRARPSIASFFAMIHLSSLDLTVMIRIIPVRHYTIIPNGPEKGYSDLSPEAEASVTERRALGFRTASRRKKT